MQLVPPLLLILPRLALRLLAAALRRRHLNRRGSIQIGEELLGVLDQLSERLALPGHARRTHGVTLSARCKTNVCACAMPQRKLQSLQCGVRAGAPSGQLVLSGSA